MNKIGSSHIILGFLLLILSILFILIPFLPEKYSIMFNLDKMSAAAEIGIFFLGIVLAVLSIRTMRGHLN